MIRLPETDDISVDLSPIRPKLAIKLALRFDGSAIWRTAAESSAMTKFRHLIWM